VLEQDRLTDSEEVEAEARSGPRCGLRHGPVGRRADRGARVGAPRLSMITERAR